MVVNRADGQTEEDARSEISSITEVSVPERSPMDPALWLARLPLFHDIDPQALARLAESSRVRRFERSDFVFRMGDPCDSFHVVLSEIGRAHV